MPFESDLAEERREASFKSGGVLFSESIVSGVKTTDIRITSTEGEASLGRPIGRYLTISFKDSHLLLSRRRAHLIKTVADAAVSLLPNVERILILGLGNRHLKSDCIGVLSAEELMKTGERDGVYCITPGTKGQSGFDAATLARGAAEALGATAVLAIDALAASGKDKLLRAVELADTGISPGRGVGGSSLPLNRETVGTRVIAVGIPTVMRASVFLKNAFKAKGAEANDCFFEAAGGGLFTLPMDLEEDTAALARVIGEALGEAIKRKKELLK